MTIYKLVFQWYCTHVERREEKLSKTTTLRHSLGLLSASPYLKREKLVTVLVISIGNLVVDD